MEMIMKKYSIIICTLLVLAGCSDWLSEDGAPKIDYSLYETEVVMVRGVILLINMGQKWGLTIHCFTNYGRITIKELEIVILR